MKLSLKDLFEFTNPGRGGYGYPDFPDVTNKHHFREKYRIETADDFPFTRPDTDEKFLDDELEEGAGLFKYSQPDGTAKNHAVVQTDIAKNRGGLDVKRFSNKDLMNHLTFYDLDDETSDQNNLKRLQTDDDRRATRASIPEIRGSRDNSVERDRFITKQPFASGLPTGDEFFRKPDEMRNDLSFYDVFLKSKKKIKEYATDDFARAAKRVLHGPESDLNFLDYKQDNHELYNPKKKVAGKSEKSKKKLPTNGNL